ncbi:hypothetical protein E4U41_003552 [Claviceps citrina]|nr:hypothetical protein E4U41_003552 [Claviceps citrina]
MLSIRSFSRSAPRAVARLTTASVPSGVVRSSILIRTSAVSAARSCTGTHHFSTTVGRRAAEGEVGDELSAKLGSELEIEAEVGNQEQLPASIKDFLENSPFELIDTPGHEVVKLVRSFGNEKITVSFSISDITNYDPFAEDAALEDEEYDETSHSSDNKQANKSRPEEEADEDDDDFVNEGSAPINVSILVEKPGKTAGGLHIEASAQHGQIIVENLHYYDDAGLAKMDTPELAHKRINAYPGPPFGSLDEDLQVLMERFLEERGITPALAVFVPDYVDAKEQKEYLRWLGNVKAFVDA